MLFQDLGVLAEIMQPGVSAWAMHRGEPDAAPSTYITSRCGVRAWVHEIAGESIPWPGSAPIDGTLCPTCIGEGSRRLRTFSQ